MIRKKINNRTDLSPKRAKKIGADWSQLPDELLSAIANRFVTEPGDFSVFIRVCTSWKSTLTNHPFTTFPWLLARNTFGKLHNICKKRFLIPHFHGDFGTPLPLELPYFVRYWGSPTGWMFCQNILLNHEAKLINPVTLVSVALPPIDHKIRKGLVFERPNSSTDGLHVMKMIDRLQVVAINGSGQSIMVAVKEQCRSGQYKKWITHEHNAYNDCKEFVDVVGLKDGLYALRSDNSVLFLSYDYDGNIFAKNTINFQPPPYDYHFSSSALVESEGELLMVVKFLEHRVFKLNLESGRWRVVEDLGNRCLFIGSSSYSTSFSIKDTEKGHRWRRNCIYFTEEDGVGSYMDFFSVKDKEIHKIILNASGCQNFGLVWSWLNCY